MGLLKKLTSALVASSLILGLVGVASANEYSATTALSAAKHMQDLGIIEGRPGGDLALTETITRAELTRVLVKSIGQGASAALLAGAPSFRDVPATHWASGDIFIAKNQAAKCTEKLGVNVNLGKSETTFDPDGRVTQAEAVAFAMKFMCVKPAAGLTWPLDYLQGAVNAKLLSEATLNALVPTASQPAQRGLVFFIVDNGFKSYKLDNGKTVYQTYVDDIGPVVTVNKINDTNTTSETSVTLSGTVKDGTTRIKDQVILHVGGIGPDFEVSYDAAGNWRTTVQLKNVGANPIVVHAIDLAGNGAVPASPVVITRVAGAAANIDAKASATSLAVGGTADITVKVTDKNGLETKDTAKFTATGAVTVDEAGKVTAGKVPGDGTVTVAVGDITKTVDFKVAAGPLAKLAADKTNVSKGEKVTLTPSDAEGNAVSGTVTYSVDSADAVVAGGVFIASKEGTYTVTAKAGEATAKTTIGVFGANAKLSITSAPDTLVANGASYYDVKVSILDANGNLVSTATNLVHLVGSAGLTVVKADETAYGGGGIAATNGVASFKVQASAASVGQVLTLTASPITASEFSASSPNGTKTVTSTAQVATSLKVSAPTYLTNDGTAKSVSVQVLDQAGKAMVANSGYWPLSVTVTGPGSLSNTSKKTSDTSTHNYSGGAAITFDVYPDTGYTGDVSVSVGVSGLETKSVTLKNVYATAPAKVVVSTTDNKTSATVNKAANLLEVKLTLQDANGVPVKPANDFTVDVSAKDGAGAAVDLTAADYATTLVGGKVTITAAAGTGSFTVGSDKAISLNFSFASTSGQNPAAPTGLTYGSTSLTFNAGDPAKVALVRNDSITIPVTDPSASLKAQIYDAYGNKVAKSGVKVAFVGNNSEVTINGTATSATVETDASGIATATAATRPFGGNSYTVTATGTSTLFLAETAAGSNDVTLDVANRVPTSVTVSVVATNGNTLTAGTAGQQAYLRVTVKDQYGVAMDNQASKLALALGSKILWSGTALTDGLPAGSSFKWDAGDSRYEIQDGGNAEVAIVLGKAGVQALAVKNTAGQTEISGSYSVVVNASTTLGAATVLEAVSGVIEVSKSAVSGPYTFQLTDAQLNAISVSPAKSITLESSSTNMSFRSSTDGVATSSVNANSTGKFFVAITSAATSGEQYTLTLKDGATTLGTVTIRIK